MGQHGPAATCIVLSSPVRNRTWALEVDLSPRSEEKTQLQTAGMDSARPLCIHPTAAIHSCVCVHR